MYNLKLTDEDYKLCESYQKTKDQNFLLKFYTKYSKNICDLIFYKMNRKLYSIPIEYGDLKHIIWKSIKAVFNEYEINKKDKNLIACVIKKSYQGTVAEIRKFLTNGEIALNNAISYESAIEKNKYFDKYTNNITYITRSYEDTYKDISSFIIKNICSLNKDDVKKVIYLKSLGYKNIEIEKKLSFSKNYLRRIIDTIKDIGKKY